jgi:hypothetical protein
MAGAVFFSDGFAEWKGKSGRPPQSNVAWKIDKGWDFPLPCCRRVDDFHMRALGSLYIGRYVVFCLSISVCGNKQCCHSYSVLQLPSETSAFFFLGCKGNVEKWSMFQLYRVRWCLNARGQAFIGDYVSEHLQFCFRVRFPVAMWDPRFIYANLCMNQGMFAGKEETLQWK